MRRRGLNLTFTPLTLNATYDERTRGRVKCAVGVGSTCRCVVIKKKDAAWNRQLEPTLKLTVTRTPADTWACFGNIVGLSRSLRIAIASIKLIARISELSEWFVGGFVDLSVWPCSHRLFFFLFSNITHDFQDYPVFLCNLMGSPALLSSVVLSHAFLSNRINHRAVKQERKGNKIHAYQWIV